MGGFNIISKWSLKGLRLSGLAGLALVTSLAAASASAGESPSSKSAAPRIERAVSTSPQGVSHSVPISVKSARTKDPTDLPLTRAAAQLRIDEMSPIRWLENFGHVSIGHRE